MAHSARRKMNISILIPFAIVALVFGALIWKKVHDSRKIRPVPQVNEPATGRKGILFFVADGSRLAREARELEACDGTEACLQDLLDELVSGPVGALEEALPAAAEINTVRLEGDLAIVDLNQAFVAEMPTGSSAEMLAVYSIVNTVCVNYPAITRVKVTVAGNGKAALNHLDLSDALHPDYSLEEPPSPSQPAGQTHDKQPAVKKGQP